MNSTDLADLNQGWWFSATRANLDDFECWPSLALPPMRLPLGRGDPWKTGVWASPNHLWRNEAWVCALRTCVLKFYMLTLQNGRCIFRCNLGFVL